MTPVRVAISRLVQRFILRTITLEGNEYPYITIEVSSESHPFYTGRQKVLSQEGNTARFQKRFGHFLGKK
ncbi:50S ribosomal protein L31 [Xenorhabdus nematophila F1]|uniref:50S ribosomal protein L31 n=1 Tax=Xenorhabdus nematophila (strain ATCC 19061 / DSM 3370 / CCUG 14189 / LMG 1036 / NCIMB 9965 / AN6) TaxID=406817 RepID=D3VG12_XENNA|nr:50S ribosomal protein L31 [Xenorhabdus nematophila]CBJ88102.1 hypothetical protein XNC1_0009 [Xenorhabdus nematophila ATCC 19061]CCW32740.1 50S ribosomal protein L31 [Xenorhabdus nematophila F1]CEE94911.1 hypothetical protein XNA1_4840014 [Xenorhabdus nematophila str. Anatoliense]CEF33599.1 hypothetical protein XNW1_4810028 [Xenorhabdus nematophila str. Websteri]CEK21016.1 hypothetical protein XNC2_0009 [Xenorhabdus nematophila AN6/1]